MTKFHHLDFDLTGGMTERDFKDAIGAVSPFVVWRDADGLHSHTVKAGDNMFYNGSLSSKNPIEIIAIGAGVTSMTGFARGKSSLKKVSCGAWDMSKVTSITYLFYEDSNLSSIDVSKWDTSALTNVAYAFRGTSIQSLDLSAWDMSRVTSSDGVVTTSIERVALPSLPKTITRNTFYTCTALKHLSFSGPILGSLTLDWCPLTFTSVCNVLDALTDTPDEGATITFKNRLYAGFTAEQKAVIDAKRSAAVAHGWTITNMS